MLVSPCTARQAIVHVWLQPHLQGSPSGSVLIKKESFAVLHQSRSGRLSPKLLRELIQTKYNVADDEDDGQSDSRIEILTSDEAGRPSPPPSPSPTTAYSSHLTNSMILHTTSSIPTGSEAPVATENVAVIIRQAYR